jgi:hypothetical protein
MEYNRKFFPVTLILTGLLLMSLINIYPQVNNRQLTREKNKTGSKRQASTVTFRNTGGTDHLAFDAIGLPGFQFIQDRIQYSLLTWHTTKDVYENLKIEDLKQASTIMATFVYQTAMLDEKFPRKSK